MILTNISLASNMNIEMSDILNPPQMQLLKAYKNIYNYETSLSFFLSLGMMSHFSQNSYYTYFSSSDPCPVQLYLWLLGPSDVVMPHGVLQYFGILRNSLKFQSSGKTYAFKQVDKAISKTEKLFPLTYLKPVIVNGAPTETNMSSIVTHTNHIGLRNHLSSNSKILLNDDADVIAEQYGIYNVNDPTKEHDRNLLLVGHDGFDNSLRTTGSTCVEIKDKRLTILIATTGGKLMKNMRNWLNCTGFDGSHNRFLYMCIPKVLCSRPQHFQINNDLKKSPSFTHLCVISHLFGSVRYVFEMSEAERMKFAGVTSNQVPSSQNIDDQTQAPSSAMFTIWNLIADLVDNHNMKQNQQQQITDFYAKAKAIVPRLACLVQLFLNCMHILEQVKDFVAFSEGDNPNSFINESFIRTVEEIIKKDYYKYDKTYLLSMEDEKVVTDPMIIVSKDAVLIGWELYEYYLRIVTKLFTIDYTSPTNLISLPPSVSARQKSLKELIMYLDFNIFPTSAISVKHPITGETGIIKNRPALGERAINELMQDNLLKYNYFLTNIRGHNVKAYMKIPPPSTNDPMRKEFVAKMLKHGINIDEYCTIYEKCSIPPNNSLSKMTLKIFAGSSCLVNQYAKYRDALTNIIQSHIANSIIHEVGTGSFIVQDPDAFDVQFHDIENWTVGTCTQQTNNRNQPTTTAFCAPASKATGQTITPIQVNIHQNIVAESSVPQHDCYIEALSSQPDIPMTQESALENNHSSERIDNLSAMSFEQIDNIESNSSHTLTSPTVKEITNTCDAKHELAVKKVMKNIMTWKSVVYTKTDLTQICNKPQLRLDAVKRLIDSKLLTYGDQFWIEPSRSKKVSEKNKKPILREGWIKSAPLTNTDAARLEFIQLLQKEVNLTYEEYLKCFYPHQQDNVFTANNWTLSETFIEKMGSNFFYKEHVRWNKEQFRPCDMIIDERNIESGVSTSIPQRSPIKDYTEKTTNNNTKDAEKQNQHAEENEVIHTRSQLHRRKRQAETDENYGVHPQTRTQTKKLRKN
ncbi:unnamed protein product [Adineta ricciae]|uniref:Uncharacterized protein n=1 Tax=Adineta ricciae TaxID=249248 RepID=A0A815Q764_ADIRI|nr:unnamed protein product [Adineta ricciae]CAF1459033.1 unnamed protein product [Adineta ricciae]